MTFAAFMYGQAPRSSDTPLEMNNLAFSFFGGNQLNSTASRIWESSSWPQKTTSETSAARAGQVLWMDYTIGVEIGVADLLTTKDSHPFVALFSGKHIITPQVIEGQTLRESYHVFGPRFSKGMHLATSSGHLGDQLFRHPSVSSIDNRRHLISATLQDCGHIFPTIVTFVLVLRDSVLHPFCQSSAPFLSRWWPVPW